MTEITPNLQEAKNWLLTNKNTSALASNRFNGSEEAIEFVNELYVLGALEVLVDNVMEEPWRIDEEGGPYADSLIVKLPEDQEKRLKLFDFINEEYTEEGFATATDTGQEELFLWWD